MNVPTIDTDAHMPRIGQTVASEEPRWRGPSEGDLGDDVADVEAHMPRINRGITGGEGSDAIQPDGGTEAHMPYRRVIGSEARGTVARGDGDDAEAHLDRSGR